MAYVQGARKPGPFADRLARQMDDLGYDVTSAYRCSGTYHGCGPGTGKGDALDFGNSVNNLRAVWETLWPLRHKFPELLGPWGLYHYGKRFYNTKLQNNHYDHVHVAVTTNVDLPEDDKWKGYTDSEKRWIREYDKLVRENRDKDRRRVLRRVMTEQRKRIWRAAQKSGWNKANRRARYKSLLARTS